MTEYIAKVDENDKVVGKTTKRESHKLGHPHRVVAVFILKKDKILINERQDNGLFDHSVGGHVRYRETYGEAAQRESFEEAGLPRDAELIYIGKFFISEKKETRKINHWFSVFILQPQESFHPRPQAGEVKRFFYKPIQEILKDMKENPRKYTEGFQATLPFFLKQKNRTLSEE